MTTELTEASTSPLRGSSTLTTPLSPFLPCGPAANDFPSEVSGLQVSAAAAESNQARVSPAAEDVIVLHPLRSRLPAIATATRRSFIRPCSHTVPHHARLDEQRYVRVALFGAVEHESVLAIEGDRSRVCFRHPEHGGLCSEHGIKQRLARPGTVMFGEQIQEKQCSTSRRILAGAPGHSHPGHHAIDLGDTNDMRGIRIAQNRVPHSAAHRAMALIEVSHGKHIGVCLFPPAHLHRRDRIGLVTARRTDRELTRHRVTLDDTTSSGRGPLVTESCETSLMSSIDARAVFAALANDASRALYAAHVLGDPAMVTLSPSKRKRATEALAAAGLLHDDDASAQPFRDLLSAVQTPPRVIVDGPERFLDEDGRLVRFPRSEVDRVALLGLIAARVLPAGERVDERTLGERITAITDDVPLLRRYLVDYGLLDRTRTGSEYWRISRAG